MIMYTECSDIDFSQCVFLASRGNSWEGSISSGICAGYLLQLCFDGFIYRVFQYLRVFFLIQGW